MKAKTIKTVLRKKFGHFLESIEDPHVKSLVKKNTIVTGGSIASMLLGEPVNDFDLYFTNKATAKEVAKYYVKRFKASPKFKDGRVAEIYVEDEDDRISIIVKSAGIASSQGEDGYEYFEGDLDPDAIAATTYVDKAMNVAEQDDRPGYEPVFISGNAITLSGKVQIILRFYGDAEGIHENFDFVHCTNYWTSADGNLVLKPAALEALLARELRYVGSKYPICSIIRLRKFIKRGFTINAGQILKMCMQISELDLTDTNVLKDQLTGVDVAYFNEIISKLKAKGDKVDSAYLTEIIDRMF